jgi:hypothetical protein
LSLTQIGGNETFGGTGDDVLGYQFSQTAGSICTGFNGSADAADIAADNGRYQSAADLNPFDNLHICGFHHCIGRFNKSDQSLCFD